MILLTGTTGLVGQFIAKNLLEQGLKFKALKRSKSIIPAALSDRADNIEWIDADVTNIIQLKKALEDVETIIHSAALISFYKPEADMMWEVNVGGTKNLIDLALEEGVQKFIYVSSVAALGRSKSENLNQQIDETNKWVKSNYNSVYAETKYNAELEVWRGVEEGLNAVVVNPSTILGPTDWSNGSTQLFKYVFDQGRYYPQGIINYVDVRDVAVVIVKLIHTELTGERFILNAGFCDYPTLFKIIGQYLGKNPPKVQLHKWLTSVAIFFESLKSLVLRTKPLITRETAMISSQRFEYDNSKVKDALNFNFRSLDESVEWTCRELSTIYPEIHFISNN